MAIFQRKNKEKGSALTKNEKLTLVISISALFLSLGQFFFSSPFFSKLIYKPEIIGIEGKVILKKDYYISTFIIKNDGNKSAENLIISLACFKNDFITMMPTLNYDVEQRKNGEPFKDIIIKTNVFLPNDYIYIQVATDSSSYKSFERQMFQQNIKANEFKLPAFNVIKHDGDFGKIERQ